MLAVAGRWEGEGGCARVLAVAGRGEGEGGRQAALLAVAVEGGRGGAAVLVCWDVLRRLWSVDASRRGMWVVRVECRCA